MARYNNPKNGKTVEAKNVKDALEKTTETKTAPKATKVPVAKPTTTTTKEA